MLGQGSIFRSVCQEFCPRKVSRPRARGEVRGSGQRGVVQVHTQGGQGQHRGGSRPTPRMHWGRHPPKQTATATDFWNAFLSDFISHKLSFPLSSAPWTLANGVFPKWQANSMNSRDVINHWSINLDQFKDPDSHISIAVTVVASWVGRLQPFHYNNNFLSHWNQIQ